MEPSPTVCLIRLYFSFSSKDESSSLDLSCLTHFLYDFIFLRNVFFLHFHLDMKSSSFHEIINQTQTQISLKKKNKGAVIVVEILGLK
jgi:hypothetical protein